MIKGFSVANFVIFSVKSPTPAAKSLPPSVCVNNVNPVTPKPPPINIFVPALGETNLGIVNFENIDVYASTCEIPNTLDFSPPIDATCLNGAPGNRPPMVDVTVLTVGKIAFGAKNLLIDVNILALTFSAPALIGPSGVINKTSSGDKVKASPLMGSGGDSKSKRDIWTISFL